MADDAASRHNRLAPAVVRQIIEETGGPSGVEEALVILETIVLGVVGFHAVARYQGHVRYQAATEFLDLLTSRVVDRFAVMDGLGKG